MKHIDPMTLERLDHHPRIAEAQHALAEAKQKLAAATATQARADAELAAAEDEAAGGQRDDKRLARTRVSAQDAASDIRIQTRAVALARERLTTVTTEVQREVFATMTAALDDRLCRLDEHLQRAREESLAAAVLEDRIQQLFHQAAYRSSEFRIILRAWRKEFGTGGRYDMWRECFATPRAPSSRGLTAVRFLKTTALPRETGTEFMTGEVAGFEPAVARELVRQGLAEGIE